MGFLPLKRGPKAVERDTLSLPRVGLSGPGQHWAFAYPRYHPLKALYNLTLLKKNDPTGFG
jgi:hypothetical protein